MINRVYFSKLKKIYIEGDCAYFVNGTNLVHVLLSIIGFIALYAVLINFEQTIIANVLVVVFFGFLTISSAFYTITSFNLVENVYEWRKYILGFPISKRKGNFSKENSLLLKEVTETDSGNEFVIYLETDKSDLVLFDIRRRSSLNKVLQFCDLTGIKCTVK
ncbi:hypothetical protein [Ekhidna sp. To15]|uniref:hypothetical protein n=1 Tax=Ekhidna sp. To15 TaxID=3395267 RepID=UPI003F5212A2